MMSLARQRWYVFLGRCGLLTREMFPTLTRIGDRDLELWNDPEFVALADLRAAVPDIEDTDTTRGALLVGLTPIPSEPGSPLIGLVGTLEDSGWDWRPAYLKRCTCCETINLTDMRRGLRCRSCGEQRVHGFAHGVLEMWGCK